MAETLFFLKMHTYDANCTVARALHPDLKEDQKKAVQYIARENQRVIQWDNRDKIKIH